MLGRERDDAFIARRWLQVLACHAVKWIIWYLESKMANDGYFLVFSSFGAEMQSSMIER